MTKDTNTTITDIVKSLYRRGFAPADREFTEEAARAAVDIQFHAVVEELGEISRMLRREKQGVDKIDRAMIAHEAADVVIAAVCLLRQAVDTAEDAENVIAMKLAADEKRGYLHRGGPLRND